MVASTLSFVPNGFRLFSVYLEQKQELANARVEQTLTTGRGARWLRVLNLSVVVVGLAILGVCVMVGIGRFPVAITTTLVGLGLAGVAVGTLAAIKLNALSS